MKNLATMTSLAYVADMTKLEELRKHLRPGQVYRRQDLARWTNAVDRHLSSLWMRERSPSWLGTLCVSKADRLRKSPSERPTSLSETFLKDKRFLLASPNTYNSLGVGTTQLYDKTVVYNHKRHGQFLLGRLATSIFASSQAFRKARTRNFCLSTLSTILIGWLRAKAKCLLALKRVRRNSMRRA